MMRFDAREGRKLIGFLPIQEQRIFFLIVHLHILLSVLQNGGG
jgi:hypothetical protein